jgi:hypothetical protein
MVERAGSGEQGATESDVSGHTSDVRESREQRRTTGLRDNRTTGPRDHGRGDGRRKGRRAGSRESDDGEW